MSRNSKFSKEIKIKACQDYLSGNGSYARIALNIGTDESSVRWWSKIYQNHGEIDFDLITCLLDKDQFKSGLFPVDC